MYVWLILTYVLARFIALWCTCLTSVWLRVFKAMFWRCLFGMDWMGMYFSGLGMFSVWLICAIMVVYVFRCGNVVAVGRGVEGWILDGWISVVVLLGGACATSDWWYRLFAVRLCSALVSVLHLLHCLRVTV